jgi:branched-subunit amino acid ABC-type transport system permease component
VDVQIIAVFANHRPIHCRTFVRQIGFSNTVGRHFIVAMIGLVNSANGLYIVCLFIGIAGRVSILFQSNACRTAMPLLLVVVILVVELLKW